MQLFHLKFTFYFNQDQPLFSDWADKHFGASDRCFFFVKQYFILKPYIFLIPVLTSLLEISISWKRPGYLKIIGNRDLNYILMKYQINV